MQVHTATQQFWDQMIMTSIESDYEQFSPLVDDVMLRLSRLPRSAFHKAAVSSLLITRMSIFARKEMLAALHSHEPIDDPAERIRAAELLSDKYEEAALLLLETERAYAQAGRVQ